MNYGYARVSTLEQNTALQFEAFLRAGVSDVYEEKQSAVKVRPVLEQLLAKVGPGDVLVVYKMDRLARSLTHLLAILAKLEGRGAAIRSLTEPIDTSTPAGRLFVHMMGSFAEFERAIIRERCAAGMKAARARGQTWGRPRGMPPEQEQEAVEMYLAGGWTMHRLAQHWGVSKMVIKRAVYRVTKPDSSVLT